MFPLNRLKEVSTLPNEDLNRKVIDSNLRVQPRDGGHCQDPSALRASLKRITDYLKRTQFNTIAELVQHLPGALNVFSCYATSFNAHEKAQYLIQERDFRYLIVNHIPLKVINDICYLDLFGMCLLHVYYLGTSHFEIAGSYLLKEMGNEPTINQLTRLVLLWKYAKKLPVDLIQSQYFILLAKVSHTDEEKLFLNTLKNNVELFKKIHSNNKAI
jgi:hypothetical protein